MAGKLMFVPDTHVVVPKEPTDRMLTAVACCSNENVPTGGCGHTFRKNIFKNEYSHAIAEAPQLTTPPVLRWEGRFLMLGKFLVLSIAEMNDGYVYQFWKFKSLQEARRAAEKALGLPEIEEV